MNNSKNICFNLRRKNMKVKNTCVPYFFLALSPLVKVLFLFFAELIIQSLKKKEKELDNEK